jgi:hypothetical protein
MFDLRFGMIKIAGLIWEWFCVFAFLFLCTLSFRQIPYIRLLHSLYVSIDVYNILCSNVPN